MVFPAFRRDLGAAAIFFVREGKLYIDLKYGNFRDRPRFFGTGWLKWWSVPEVLVGADGMAPET